jgi:hypothetical protein
MTAGIVCIPWSVNTHLEVSHLSLRCRFPWGNAVKNENTGPVSLVF